MRHAPRSFTPPAVADDHLGGTVERLVYSREQAAQALGISLATLNRRVVPAIATIKTEWGAQLIPVGELKRYLAERREEPQTPPQRRRSGRRSCVPHEVVARIRSEHRQGVSLGQIARRLNHDDIPTGQGGRRWWASTVRVVLLRSGPSSSQPPSRL